MSVSARRRDRTPPDRLPPRARRMVLHWQREALAARQRGAEILDAIAGLPGITPRTLLLASRGARSLRTGTLEWKQMSTLLADDTVVAFCDFCHAPSASSARAEPCEIEKVIGACRASGGERA